MRRPPTVPCPSERALGSRRALLLRVLGSAVLAAIPAALLVARPAGPIRGAGLLDVPEHEEGAAKRARARSASFERMAQGIRPLHVESGPKGFDVLSYDVSLSLDPAVRQLEGTTAVRVSFTREGVTAVRLDFDPSYEVLSATRDGQALTVSRAGDGAVLLPVDPPLHSEERTTFTVSYRGVPPSLGALGTWTHASGTAASTVAEPFDARTFWPCVDDPGDKAVTTVRITVPDAYTAVSAGSVSTAPAADGRTTHTWTFAEPISTYLVSLAVANYVKLEATYTSLDGTRTMPVVGYVVPEHAAWNAARVQATVGYVRTLAQLFGEYPFLSYKYGMAEGHFSGGMEHPTVSLIGATQLGSSTRDLTYLLVHELAHQWWGDDVTMATWDDIWLNEGFATYAEVLYAERAAGASPGRLLTTRYDDGLYAGALGPTVVAPVDDPFRYTASVYDKGGWVLHMLRRLVGDETFFRGLDAYRRRFRQGNATRGDLRSVFEEVSGRELKSFFDQWVETPFRPVLRVAYQPSADGTSVAVVVRQVQAHDVVHPQPSPGDVAWYVFPLTIRIGHPDGTAEDATTFVDAREAHVTVPTPSRKAVSDVVVDPDGDLLKVVEAVGPGA